MPLVELVRAVTGDGLRLDGVLAAAGPRPSAPGNCPSAALLLHGVAGNFYTSSTFEPLVPMLQELGLDVLSVNTRGHDSVFGASLGNVRRRFGAAYETVDDCRLDIAAWIALLKSQGHKRIVLVGHSLGAIKAVYAHAQENYPEVAAVVAVSAPRLSYSAFMNAAESSSLFWESMNTAEQMVKAGRGDDLFTSKYPFPLLITAVGYLDKYGPAERYNILRYAADLPCPTLFTYGSRELSHGGIAFAGVPDALLELSNSGRREIKVVEGADHIYTGVAALLATQVAGWLVSL